MARHPLGRRSGPGSWPRRPATGPACSRAFRTEARPHSRRIRWLWGAFEQLRRYLADLLPADDCQQTCTSALPVKHASQVRGADGWTGRTACMPGLAATPRTANGFTASAWRPRPTSAPGSSGPGASCPPPSATATSARTSWRPGHRRVTCSLTRASTAPRSPLGWLPGVPPCWSRLPKTTGASPQPDRAVAVRFQRKLTPGICGQGGGPPPLATPMHVTVDAKCV
jgi:hypothetical protein